MRVLRPREGRCVVPGHTAYWGQSWRLNLGLPISLRRLVLPLPPASLAPKGQKVSVQGRRKWLPSSHPTLWPLQALFLGGRVRAQMPSLPYPSWESKALPLSHQVTFGLDYRHNYI